MHAGRFHRADASFATSDMSTRASPSSLVRRHTHSNARSPDDPNKRLDVDSILSQHGCTSCQKIQVDFKVMGQDACQALLMTPVDGFKFPSMTFASTGTLLTTALTASQARSTPMAWNMVEICMKITFPGKW